MAMTPEGHMWMYISLHYTKRPIEIVLCIWMANCGMSCLSLFKILGILNHFNVIIECTNLSLTHDRIDILRFFAICQFLHEVFNISWLSKISSTLYMLMVFCILLGTEIKSHSMLYLRDWFRRIDLIIDLFIHMSTFIFYRICINEPCFMLMFLWSWISIVLLYMARPHVKQPLADESSWLNII